MSRQSAGRVRRSLAISLTVMSAAGIIVFAGGPFARQPVEDDRPECPLPVVTIKQESHGFIYESPDVPDAGRIADIPEYHDCQRLVVGDTYGPLAGVYARYRLENMWTRLVQLDSIANAAQAKLGDSVRLRDSVAGAVRRRLTTLARNFGFVAPSDSALGRATAVAWRVRVERLVSQSTLRALHSVTIRAWGRYPKLGIEEGWNCVYISNSRNPRARIINLPQGQKKCPAAVKADTAGGNVHQLVLKRTRTQGSVPDDYPPVARWEWDDANKHQYIGFMCDGWCEAGPVAAGNALFAAATLPSAAAASEEVFWGTLLPEPPFVISGNAMQRRKKRIALIKGWFDQEQLAPDAPSRGVNPIQTRGAIFPAPDLENLTMAADFVPNRWVHVAAIAMSQHDLGYAAKFNFVSDIARNTVPIDTRTLATLELCRGENCAGQLAADLCVWPNDESQPDPPPMANRWWARVISGPRHAADTSYNCVIRRPHDGVRNDDNTPVRVPGTVRWRWLRDDQTVWVRCDLGCCEVIP